jgi:hypothetical protein
MKEERLMSLESSNKATTYDDDNIIITPRFERAIHELLRAEMDMMRNQITMNAECWTWGACRISNGRLIFSYGSNEDKPTRMGTADTMITVGGSE